MTLEEYFDNAKGYGVLATADSAGKVNAAVYARPHVMDEKTVAFIIKTRATLTGNLGEQRSTSAFCTISSARGAVRSGPAGPIPTT